MKIIFDYNRTLFNPDTNNLYPDVFLVLKTLAAGHQLFLITLNKPERKDAVAITDIQQFFEEVVFVERKTVTEFQRIAGEEKNVVVIGDRFEDEIRIGIQLGFITIHLPSEKMFYKKNQKPTHVITSLKQVLKIIERNNE